MAENKDELVQRAKLAEQVSCMIVFCDGKWLTNIRKTHVFLKLKVIDKANKFLSVRWASLIIHIGKASGASKNIWHLL